MSIQLIDSYNLTYQSNGQQVQATYPGAAHSFIGRAGDLRYVKFYVKKEGSPAGNATAVLYAHSGNYGTSSVPTGAALGTSDTIDVSELGTNYSLITFTFTGAQQYTMIEGVKYCIALAYSGGDISNRLVAGHGIETVYGHPGNLSAVIGGSWVAVAPSNLCFYVYADVVTTATGDIISIGEPVSLTTTKEINGPWTAKMRILEDDYIAAESYVDIDSETYIVKKLRKIKNGGKTYFDVDLYHNMSELADISIDQFHLYKTPTNYMDTFLAGSAWTKGTMSAYGGGAFPLRSDRRINILEALYLLANKYNVAWELNFNSATRTVDLLETLGTATKLQIRYDKNCDYIEKEEDSTELVTRLYPYGPDNQTINTTRLDDCDDASLYTASGAGVLADYTQNRMQGSGSISISSGAQNETYTRDLGAGNEIDLSGHDTIKFWINTFLTAPLNTIAIGFGEAAWWEQSYLIPTAHTSTDYWKEYTWDISGIADAAKDAVRYIGVQYQGAGAYAFLVDDIRAFDGNIYLDSANIATYKINKEMAFFTSSDVQSEIEAQGQAYLDDHDEPKLRYKVHMADLSKAIVDTWEDETISLGDTVRVYDSDLGINVDCRVRKITKDLLNPTNTDIELTNRAYDITDLQAKLEKQLKYAMPFNDNKRIIYANTIQEGYIGESVG